MRGNVEKVLERDQKLSQLDDRADALQQGARYFFFHYSFDLTDQPLIYSSSQFISDFI